jgi:hypothetical protein
MGPFDDLPEVPGVDHAPDHAARLKEILARLNHPTLAVLMPGQAGVTDPTATWIDADPDPRLDNTPVTVSRPTLGMLCDYLEARFGRRPS